VGIIRDGQGSRRGAEEGMGEETSLQAGEIAYVDTGRGTHEKLGVAGAWVGTQHVKPKRQGNSRPTLSSHRFTCSPH